MNKNKEVPENVLLTKKPFSVSDVATGKVRVMFAPGQPPYSTWNNYVNPVGWPVAGSILGIPEVVLITTGVMPLLLKSWYSNINDNAPPATYSYTLNYFYSYFQILSVDGRTEDWTKSWGSKPTVGMQFGGPYTSPPWGVPDTTVRQSTPGVYPVAHRNPYTLPPITSGLVDHTFGTSPMGPGISISAQRFDYNEVRLVEPPFPSVSGGAPVYSSSSVTETYNPAKDVDLDAVKNLIESQRKGKTYVVLGGTVSTNYKQDSSLSFPLDLLAPRTAYFTDDVLYTNFLHIHIGAPQLAGSNAAVPMSASYKSNYNNLWVKNGLRNVAAAALRFPRYGLMTWGPKIKDTFPHTGNQSQPTPEIQKQIDNTTDSTRFFHEAAQSNIELAGALPGVVASYRGEEPTTNEVIGMISDHFNF